jgi:hypothetical protein
LSKAFSKSILRMTISLGFMANMQKLEGPGYTVLYCSSMVKTILVFMHKL